MGAVMHKQYAGRAGQNDSVSIPVNMSSLHFVPMNCVKGSHRLGCPGRELLRGRVKGAMGGWGSFPNAAPPRSWGICL